MLSFKSRSKISIICFHLWYFLPFITFFCYFPYGLDFACSAFRLILGYGFIVLSLLAFTSSHLLSLGPEIDVDLPGGPSSALSPDAGLDLSADVDTPNVKGKAKGGFKLPLVEGTIDLRPPSGHIGLDADLSPISSPSGTLKKTKPSAGGMC